MKLIAHSTILLSTFITVLLSLVAAVAVIVAVLSFVMWVVPPVPTTETLLVAGRILIAIATLVTASYAFSSDYKEYVQEFLSR